jgi:hypothetical protein
MKQRCKTCGKAIKVMIRKNTGFCTEACEEEWNSDDLF